MVAAAACSSCPTLVVARGAAPELPSRCPNCGAALAPQERSWRDDHHPVAYVLRVGPGAVVGLQADLDLFSRDRVRAAVDAVLDWRPAAVLVDLADVAFADATAIAELSRLRRLLGTPERLISVAPVGEAARVFEITGLREAFNMRPTRQEAVAALHALTPGD